MSILTGGGDGEVVGSGGIKRSNEKINAPIELHNIRNNNSHNNEVDEDDDEIPIRIKKPKPGNKIILEEEEEWRESDDERSEDMELEFEFESEKLNEKDESKQQEKKKRKLSTPVEQVKNKTTITTPISTTSSTTTTTSKNKNTNSSKEINATNLPPRPKITTEASSPAKSYQQFTANSAVASPSRSMVPNSPSSMRSVSPSPSIDSKQGNNPSQSELSADNVGGYGSHDHHTWDFLHKNRKDKDGRPFTHPDFNPRTILFPPSFLKDQTPAMKQWCEVKSENFDVVLFFKVTLPNNHYLLLLIC